MTTMASLLHILIESMETDVLRSKYLESTEVDVLGSKYLKCQWVWMLLILLGRKKVFFALQSYSSWFKNQIDKRQINRKSKFNNRYTSCMHRRDSGKLINLLK